MSHQHRYSQNGINTLATPHVRSAPPISQAGVMIHAFALRQPFLLPIEGLTCPVKLAASSASDRLASRMEEGGATVQTFMTGALARLSTGVQGVGQTVGAGVQT